MEMGYQFKTRKTMKTPTHLDPEQVWFNFLTKSTKDLEKLWSSSILSS